MQLRPGMTVPLPGHLHAQRDNYKKLADLGYTDIWSAESDGADAFTPLAMAAAWEPRLRLGTAIVPAYTRSPALMAQSVATPADAALMMYLGCEGVFVGSGIFMSEDPPARARAIVEATTPWDDPEVVARVSRGLREAMPGLEIAQIAAEGGLLQTRGW